MDLVVDIDVWLTDTGLLADYVLPDCMPFERKEILDMAGYGHIVLTEPAIEPMGETKPLPWITTELAKRLGLGEYFDKTIDEWLEVKLDTDYPAIAHLEPKVTLERLEKEKMIPIAWPEDMLFDPLLGLNISTATGRVEFYSERLVEVGLGLPTHLETLESPTATKKNPEFPYHFFSGRQRFFMQSMFTNDDLMIELSGKEPSARMNPIDAAREGIDRPSGTWPNLKMGWIPIMSKSCVMCNGRTTQGELPYCVNSCPTEAMTYGDLGDENSAVAKKIEELRDRDFRIFRLPAWENSKEGVVYASKRS